MKIAKCKVDKMISTGYMNFSEVRIPIEFNKDEEFEIIVQNHVPTNEEYYLLESDEKSSTFSKSELNRYFDIIEK